MASGEFPSRGIAAVWGVRPPGRRGPTPGLSIGQIVECAAGLADSEGLGAVTLPAVAARVGVATNSLYRYVESKDELLLLLFDDGLGEPPTELPSGERWRVGAREWLEGAVERYATRPWLLDVQLRSAPITPNALGWLDSLLTVLDGSPWDDDDALQLATLLDRLAHAIARLRVGVLDTGTDRPPREQVTAFLHERANAYGYARVERLIDREVYGGSVAVFDLDRALDWVFASVTPTTRR